MKTIINKIKLFITTFGKNAFDFILPKRQGSIYLDKLTPAEFATSAKKAPSMITDGVDALFLYRDDLVKGAIWELKYRGNKKAAQIFAECLFDNLIAFLAEESLFENSGKPIVIPMPISLKRYKERGFNQCQLVTDELANLDKNLQFQIKTEILKKIKDTPSQTKTDGRKERLQNLKGAFAVSQKEELQGKTVFLIDDVVTTGATFTEAKNALLNAGARKVICLALAH